MSDDFLDILKGMSIICVEDEDGVRKRLVNTLKFYFYKVLEARDGMEAFNLYLDNYIDIIITDIDMPKTDGIEFIKKVRSKNLDIPVIVLTAYSNEEYLMELINLQINHYILKPTNSEKLLNALKHSIKDTQISKIKLSDDIVVDFSSMEIIYNDKSIKITNREKLFLKLLFKNRNRVTTYDQIEEFVWKNDTMSSSALKTFIKVLRKKFPVEIIENISGTGYRLCNLE